MLASIEASQLLVIDVQEKLLPLTCNHNLLKENIPILIRSSLSLDIPIHLFEQYPEKLGSTDPDIKSLIPAIAASPKTAFSCSGAENFFLNLDQHPRKEIILCGIETHVCVLQTAINLHAIGYKVFVVVDAVSARHHINHDMALQRMQRNDITLVTTEMLVFEWLRDAKHPHFKALATPFKSK